MSWVSHYVQQAKAQRTEANQWLTHGHEGRATFHLLAAEVYDELAEEAEINAEKRAENEQLRPEPC